MRLGHVIGKVTLSKQDAAFRGARFLLVQPLAQAQFAGAGHIVGFTEGAEASAPFDQPTPVDAYNAAIIDELFYNPPSR